MTPADVRPPISRKPEVVRARILQAAEAEFRLYGYDEAKTNRIAKGFGGAKNTIFRHFESKKVLFLSVIEALIMRWRDKLDLESIECDEPAEWLEAYAVEILKWIISDEMIFVANMADLVRGRFPEIIEIFRRTGHGQYLAILKERLDEWTRAGILDCDDPEEDATDFLNLALVKWLNRRKLEFAPMPSEQQLIASARRSVALFLHGRLARMAT